MEELKNPRWVNEDLLASLTGLGIGEDPGAVPQPPCQPCPPSCAPYGTPSQGFGVTRGMELSRGHRRAGGTLLTAPYLVFEEADGQENF